MSRNGSGTYAAPASSWNPPVAATQISVTDWIALLADLTTAMSASIANDGQTTCSAMIPFAAGLKVSDGLVGTPAITFTADTDNGFYRIGSNDWAGAAGATKVIEFTSTGVALPLLLDISGASAGQVKFPATQNASANANTFDDYKEAAFTPIVNFGGASVGVTYAASGQIGTVTKIGNRVFFSVHIVLTSKGSSTGTLTIDGLPTAAIATGGHDSAGSPYLNFVSATVVSAFWYIAAGGAGFNLWYMNAGSIAAITDALCTNGSAFTFSGSYEAA